MAPLADNTNTKKNVTRNLYIYCIYVYIVYPYTYTVGFKDKQNVYSVCTGFPALQYFKYYSTLVYVRDLCQLETRV